MILVWNTTKEYNYNNRSYMKKTFLDFFIFNTSLKNKL